MDRELAERYGIELSYVDATGTRRDASPEVVRRIIEAREEAVARRKANPVVVQWDREPYGYETRDDGTMVISAPRRAHPLPARQWGLFVPLSAIDGRFDDLKQWRDALGGDFIATLPLLMPHDGERSPYMPSSRLFWNERYGSAEEMRALADSTPLYLDFPLGVHPDGHDVRNHRQSFVKAMSVGAPPDSFFTSILRLDHVMGLHRLYWIPDGADAKDGVYVRYHDEELYAILTLESHLHRCAIVGEDLGTVPDEVRDAMTRHGLRRMFVVQYEANPALPDPPAQCVASVNTHDMPPFAAFARGLDVDDRVEQGLLDEEGARNAREGRAKIIEAIGSDVENILERLARSDAEAVLVNPEDLWGETQPQNVPGVPERSWKQRFRLSLEEARSDPNVRRILAKVSGARLA